MNPVTRISFQPSTSAAFTFRPTLSSVQYTAIITWNIFGLRYYLNLYDLSGNLIIATAVITSGQSQLATFSWYENLATVTVTAPHNVPIGAPVNIVAQNTNSAFDGLWQALSTTINTLTYALSTNPEVAPGVYVPHTTTTTMSGSVRQYVNLVEPVLPAGWLLYLEDTEQFEYA